MTELQGFCSCTDIRKRANSAIAQGSESSYPRVFSLNFQEFSFILYFLMDVFPVMFYHQLEPVGPCFEEDYENFLSDFVENVSDRALSALTVRDVVLGEFSFDITKQEEVIWCEVRAVSLALYPLYLFA
jgi:hypothetical protein